MSQHPDFAAAVAQSIDLHEAVRKYRANEVALRRLAKSRPSRNVGATIRAHQRREHDRSVIELSLTLAGHTSLVGALTDERKVLVRLDEAREAGQERPELKFRLLNNRRAITLLSRVAG